MIQISARVEMPPMLRPRIREAAGEEVRAGGQALLEVIQYLSPGGRVRESWKVRHAAMSSTVYSDYNVARFLNDGTGKYGIFREGYKIRAKKGKNLRIPLKGMRNVPIASREEYLAAGFEPHQIPKNLGDRDNFMFRKSVKHPGVKARHYVEAAEKIALPEIRARIEIAVRKAIDDALPTTTKGRYDVRGGNPLNTGRFS